MLALFRLLVFLGIFAGLIYGGMFALAELVEPERSETSYKLPRERLP